MKGKIKIGLLLTVVCLSLLGMAACSGGEDSTNRQLVKVERGDMEISVTGSGTIEATREARLTFGSSGKVDEILVKEGDEVKEGDVLSKLDTSTLELAYAQAEVSLASAELALTQAEVARQSAADGLKTIRDSEDALEVALLNTQIALDQANRLLSTGIAAADYEAALAQLNRAKAWYKYVTEDWTGDADDYQEALDRAEEQMDVAQAEYDNVLSGYNSAEIAIKRKQVEAAELAVAQAQKNLDDLAEDIAIQEMQVASATQSATYAQQSVGLAQKSLADAQRQLDEATITAPFDGIVASVPVKEGDSIPSPSMAPTMVIYLVDPNYMELVVEVDEIDIPLLELGQEAVVSVDALTGSEFRGTVTAISPIPIEVGGVVLYDVRMTMEVPNNSGIKIGMSASADVMIVEHSDVLLVPSRAVQQNAQGQTIVKVASGDDVEERPVTVGLDDGLRTEIVSGLNEGETVIVELTVKSTSMSMF